MASLAGPTQALPSRPRLKRQLKEFGRGLAYQVAGLPIAVRGLFERGMDRPEVVIRRAYARRYWRPRDLTELTQLALALIIWPFTVIILAAVFATKNGSAAWRSSHRPIHRQLLDQARLYLTSGVLPPWYYIFELYRQPESRRARNYIYRWESKGGVMPLLREGDRVPRSELNDKAHFAEYCHSRGLPAVPTLAVFREGQLEMLADSGAFNADLFVKPVLGRGGKGAERWDFANGLYRCGGRKWFTREELFKLLKERSHSGAVMIQPRLSNDRVLDGFNNHALSTVRVLTCLDESGEPEVVGAAMRMAIGRNHTVDNLHAGGIATAVDLLSGRLGPASNLGANSKLGWVNGHPTTGARINGTKLPFWDEVQKLALAAHQLFDDRVIVGWDIAIVPGGPILIEGNGSPDLDIMQRFIRQGLMPARLGELLAFHVSQLELPAAA